MRLYKNLCFVFVIALMFFSVLACVSAVTYNVNSTWLNSDIQGLIDGKSDIDGLYFDGSVGMIYNVCLDITKVISVTCAEGVKIVGSAGGFNDYAFNIASDNVKISDFTISGYITAICSNGFKNITINNNTLVNNMNSIDIKYSNGVNVSRNKIFDGESDGVVVDSSKNVNISNNDIAVRLQRLGFEVSFNGDNMHVVSPTWRSTGDISPIESRY